MRASAFMAGEPFIRLRRRIAQIEGRSAVADTGHGAPVLPLGVACLDRLLGGGLRRDALHEIRGAITRDGGAATGFACAVLARLAAVDGRPFLWVTEEAAAREGGFPHGPGLDGFGLDPRRLVVVTARRPKEVLWVFEEGLRCAGLAAVLAEIRGHPRPLDLTAGRRLSLRAREGGVMGLLLRQAVAAEPGPAATRWRVVPRPAASDDAFPDGIGRPAWRLVLERNRAGRGEPGTDFDLEWDHEGRIFSLATAPLSRDGAAPSQDRPDPARAAGTVVALRRAS